MNRRTCSVQALPMTSRPLAAAGLKSYRYRLPFSFVMIGAHDDSDALKQAARNTDAPSMDKLERWDGSAYTPCISHAAKVLVL